MVVKLTLNKKNPIDNEIINFIESAGLSNRHRSVLLKMKIIEGIRNKVSLPAAVAGPESISAESDMPKSVTEIQKRIAASAGRF
jgi:hypothetical protein